MAPKSKFSFPEKTRAIAKALFSFFIPGGLLFLVTAIILHLKILDNVLSELALVYPFIVIGAGVLLGLFFKQIWLLFAILILALADKSLLYFAANTAASTEGGRLIYNSVSLLLPLNLYVITLVEKRGIIARQSILFLGWIILQGLGITFIYRYQNLELGTFLDHSFEWPLLKNFPLSQLAFFFFGIVFLYFLVRYIRIRKAMEQAFIWALISTFSALVVSKIGPVSSIYFTTAGLIFVISVIENIYVEGFQDDLTELPSRKVLGRTLSKLGTGYTVAMIEIDHFKRIKDNHGRRMSRQALRMVGSKLSSVTGGGTAFRYRGEVFIVVFPGMFLQDTLSHMEKSRMAIKESGIILRGRKRPRITSKKQKEGEIPSTRIPVTVSIGVAERSDLDMSPQKVIKKAEEALSVAKKEGHDQMHPSAVTVEFEQRY